MNPVRLAILMSGSGTNAEKIIEYCSHWYEPVVIITDNPDSRCAEIGSKFGVEHVIAIRSQKSREEYDSELAEILKEYSAGLTAAAGYRWIISRMLLENHLILNVHPGDLRVRNTSGVRAYTGLGWIPVAKAVKAGEKNVYSTVHVIETGVDTGTIGAVSDPVPIQFASEDEKKKIMAESVKNAKNPDSALRRFSDNLQETLKKQGDWQVFPRALDRAAQLIHEKRLIIKEGAVLLDGEKVTDMFLTEE